MTSDNYDIILGGILIFCILSCLVIIWIPTEEVVYSEDVGHYTDCSNMTTKDTAYCLRDYVKLIYNYKITDDWQNLTLEELIEDGGDCHDWNLLYERMSKELGFNSHSFHIEGIDWGHRVAFIVGEDGYCLLDQTAEPKCFNAI